MYQTFIYEFEKAYSLLQIPISPEVHVLVCHLPEFLRMYPHGLSRYSEQANESLHHDFAVVYGRYKVSNVNHLYCTKLLLSVIF